MMKFKYFKNPELYVGLRASETICDTCGQSKRCFEAEGFYGIHNLRSICPECLGSGKLMGSGAFTCIGDSENLVEQLTQLNPGLTADEIQAIAKQKTIELENTNPSLVTWQEWPWPCADGDYCKFIGYGSKPFYISLAQGMPVEAFFKASFHEPESWHEDQWTDEVPDKLIKDYEDSSQYGTLFYVFKSLHSDKIITTWDSD